MEEKKEYIERLLSETKKLQEIVTLMESNGAVSFTTIRNAYDKVQNILSSLHDIEFLQIGEMKAQMEKLVLVLSESETQKEEVVEEPITERFVSSEETKCNSANDIQLPQYINRKAVELPIEEAHCDNYIGEKELSTEENTVPTIKSVNDTIQAPSAKLDVKRSLSLNDRFYYQRELFENNREAMNSLMLRINAFDNYPDVEKYLRESTTWDFDDKTVEGFMETLRKGFR